MEIVFDFLTMLVLILVFGVEILLVIKALGFLDLPTFHEVKPFC